MIAHAKGWSEIITEDGYHRGRYVRLNHQNDIFAGYTDDADEDLGEFVRWENGVVTSRVYFLESGWIDLDLSADRESVMLLVLKYGHPALTNDMLDKVAQIIGDSCE